MKMDKKNKMFLIGLIICAIIVIIFCAHAIIKYKNEKNTDALTFKNEFESLNGVLSEINDKEYLTVSIPEANPIKYKSDEEILEILKNEEAVVFFGYANDPYCRSIIETLLKSAKNNGVSKIYYVDILNIRDSYEFNGSITPNQTKKGTDSYYKILKFLSKHLEKYYVKDEEGNMYDTGVKRLHASTVVTVRKGKVVDLHTFTVDSETDIYKGLNKTQKKELKEIYDKMFDNLLTKTCNIKSC